MFAGDISVTIARRKALYQLHQQQQQQLASGSYRRHFLSR
jgi:hypothetical protein